MRKNFFSVLVMVFLSWSVDISGGFAFAAESYAKTDKTAGLNIPDVVARINGVELNSKFIKFEFNRMMRNVKEELDAKQKTDAIREIIDTEVVRELMFQEGKARNKKVPSEKVEEEFAAIKSGYEREEEFLEALKQRDITADDLKRSIEVDFIARDLIDDQIKEKINITEEDAKKFYDDNKQSFFRPESYRAQHIFVSFYPAEMLEKYPPMGLESKKDDAMVAKAEKKINEAFKQVQGGADFGKLAEKYSEDAGSSSKGGDLDFIYKGVLAPEFDEAVSNLKPGEISGIVKTAYGYHIIKLNEIRPAEYALFAEMKEAIQKHLFTEEAKNKVQKYLAGLKKKAKIEVFF